MTIPIPQVYAWLDPVDPNMAHLGVSWSMGIYHTASIHTDGFRDIFGDTAWNELTTEPTEVIITMKVKVNQ